MNLIDMIGGRQGGQGFAALGRQFGLDEGQSRAAVEQLAPVLMAGLRRNTQSADGLSGLIGALAGGQHGRYLDEDDTNIEADGNAILGHVFGSKDVSRGVAAEASQRSGIDGAILKQMLPVIAAMVMGALAKNTTGGRGTGGGAGGLGDILGQVLGGSAGQSSAQSSGGGLGGILGQILGGGQPANPPSEVRVGTNAGQIQRGPAADQGGGLGDILGGLLGGGQGAAASTQAGNPDVGGLLDGIFGSNAAPEVRAEATRRAGDTFGNILGGGTPRAMDADALLDSVQRAVRGR